MPVDLILRIILILAPNKGTLEDHRAVVEGAVEACAAESAWAGDDCLPALAAVLHAESHLRAAPGRRWGAGAGQAQPSRPFNWRGQKLTTPRAKALEHPATGALWGLRILETKDAWCRQRFPKASREERWRCAFKHYNSTSRAVSYARHVFANMKRLRVAIGKPPRASDR